MNKIPLWIPENGYASINPPLSRSRRGSLSTKTTHPKFLGDLISLLDSVGAHSDLANPYANITKGEMFAQVRDAFGVEVASAFLSETSSCSHTGAKTYGISPKVACGVCFGCVLRRASFAASGVADTTTYLVPSGAKQTAWVADKSVIPAMRNFLREPFGESDLARLQLPSGVSLAEVNELCRRTRGARQPGGVDEVERRLAAREGVDRLEMRTHFWRNFARLVQSVGVMDRLNTDWQETLRGVIHD